MLFRQLAMSGKMVGRWRRESDRYVHICYLVLFSGAAWMVDWFSHWTFEPYVIALLVYIFFFEIGWQHFLAAAKISLRGLEIEGRTASLAIRLIRNGLGPEDVIRQTGLGPEEIRILTRIAKTN